MHRDKGSISYCSPLSIIPNCSSVSLLWSLNLFPALFIVGLRSLHQSLVTDETMMMTLTSTVAVLQFKPGEKKNNRVDEEKMDLAFFRKMKSEHYPFWQVNCVWKHERSNWPASCWHWFGTKWLVESQNQQNRRTFTRYIKEYLPLSAVRVTSL